MMCTHTAPSIADLIAKKPSPVPAALPTEQGSQRRKLWDLPSHAHCAVVDVRLPLGALRKIMAKLMPEAATWHDHAVHSQAVSSSRSRNVLSDTLHKAIEVRHAGVVQVFRKAKTTADVLNLWLRAVDLGDVSGALWASLTHPRCDCEIESIISHDIHMLQHQARVGRHVDIAKLDALLNENAVLAAKDRQLTFLQAELMLLRQALPDLENRQRLQERMAQATQRQAALEDANSVLRRKIAASEVTPPPAAPTVVELAMVKTFSKAHTQPIQPILRQETVLCVGSRTGKRCVFVESASTSALTRSLEGITVGA